MPTSSKTKQYPIALYSLIIFFACLTLFTLGTCFFLEVNVKDFAIAFINNYFRPTSNYCVAQSFFNVHPLKLIYAFFFLIFTTICGLAMIVGKSSIPWKKLSLRILSCCSMTFIIFLCTLQIISRINLLHLEFDYFHSKDSKFLHLQEFTSKAKAIVGGRHQAKIRSDQNLSVDPYQLMQRTLSYYLYPVFSVRFANNTPKDCIIYFDKKNLFQGIPKDYQIIYINPTGYLALAVKKELLKNAD